MLLPSLSFNSPKQLYVNRVLLFSTLYRWGTENLELGKLVMPSGQWGWLMGRVSPWAQDRHLFNLCALLFPLMRLEMCGLWQWLYIEDLLSYLEWLYLLNCSVLALWMVNKTVFCFVLFWKTIGPPARGNLKKATILRLCTILKQSRFDSSSGDDWSFFKTWSYF